MPIFVAIAGIVMPGLGLAFSGADGRGRAGAGPGGLIERSVLTRA